MSSEELIFLEAMSRIDSSAFDQALHRLAAQYEALQQQNGKVTMIILPSNEIYMFFDNQRLVYQLEMVSSAKSSENSMDKDR